MADWQATGSQGTWREGTPGGYSFQGDSDVYTSPTQGYWEGRRDPTGPAPTRDQYTRREWTNTQTLNPNEQALYDANNANQRSTQGSIATALGQVQAQQGQEFNPNLPAWQSSLQGANLATPTQRAVTPGALPTDVGNPNAYGSRSGNLAPSAQVAAPNAQYANRQGEIADILGQLQGMNPQGYNDQARDAMYSQATRYLQPQQQQETQALEARLAEQGFVPGTPAYTQAMQNLRQTQDQALADARDRALLTGAQVGSQQFGDQLSALGLGASSSLNRAQFGATSDQAQFARDMGVADFNVGQGAQNFNQRLSGAQFGAGEDQADFSRRQQAAQMLAQLQQQNFTQQSSLADRDRQMGMDANAVSQQLFENNAQAAQFQNNSRQQQIAEALMRRQLPLNELNALRTGTQVGGVPNLGGQQQPVPGLQGTDIMGAIQQQYGQQLGAHNSNVASDNASMAAIASIIAAMIPSDMRLKRDIHQIGVTPGGFPWYTFRYLWDDAVHEGVMAQEIQDRFPEAVHTTSQGYLLVDYSKVH